jgi:hypothetical protein
VASGGGGLFPDKRKPVGYRKRASWHGQAEHKMQDREEILSRKLLKETAKRAEQLMHERGAEVIVVGDHQETIPEFIALLTKPVQSKIAGHFVIDTNTMPPTTIRNKTGEILEAYERDEEVRLFAELLKWVAAGAVLGNTAVNCGRSVISPDDRNSIFPSVLKLQITR